MRWWHFNCFWQGTIKLEIIFFFKVHRSFLNKKHPNIKFTLEKQINHSIAFLDVFISGTDNQNPKLETYFCESLGEWDKTNSWWI